MNTNNWSALARALGSTYATFGKTARLTDDLAYLADAFDAIECLWEKQFRNLADVRLVLLSEAPLFGIERSYFYNPIAPATAFFTYVAAEGLVGKIEGTSSLVNGARPRKEAMIRRLTEEGIILLDLFPFALNPKHTAVTYSQLSRSTHYERLFEATAEHHFLPKLSHLKDLAQRPPLLAFRYLRLQQRIAPALCPMLRELGMLAPDSVIESFHKGQHLDHERLAALLA